MPSFSSNKIVILTQGHSLGDSCKTAINMIYYRSEKILGVLDSEQAGKTTSEIFKSKQALPFKAKLSDFPDADALLIGLAPSGGKLPESWRSIIKEALQKNLTIISGLHTFLSDDSEFSALVKAGKGVIFDIRKNNEKEVADGQPFKNTNLRIHAVGNDCSLGKMVVTVEIDQYLKKKKIDSKFIATGQTGIMIEGDGCPVDCVVSDFVNGSAERLCRSFDHHEILMVEGQGSLFHPKYSAVTLGLLHGCRPQGMIFCYEAARKHILHMPGFALPDHANAIRTIEHMASIMEPSKVIAIAINGKGLTKAEIKEEQKRMEDRFLIPASDVYVDGPEILANEVLKFQKELIKNGRLKAKAK
jgi:uncharacterized NAD-dependent epimerase/dehydratase family protein